MGHFDEHEHNHEHHSHEHHEHNHPHTHIDENGNEYTHTHEHCHDEVEVMETEKVKKMLAYMISHNDHHTEELADLIDSLPEKSKEKLLKAIGTFEAANVELKGVLDSLE